MQNFDNELYNEGLDKFPYVYIVNGVSEFIPTVMVEHSLRPVCVEGEYQCRKAEDHADLLGGMSLES